jgi:hypothetical protein
MRELMVIRRPEYRFRTIASDDIDLQRHDSETQFEKADSTSPFTAGQGPERF